MKYIQTAASLQIIVSRLVRDLDLKGFSRTRSSFTRIHCGRKWAVGRTSGQGRQTSIDRQIFDRSDNRGRYQPLDRTLRILISVTRRPRHSEISIFPLGAFLRIRAAQEEPRRLHPREMSNHDYILVASQEVSGYPPITTYSCEVGPPKMDVFHSVIEIN